MGGNKKEISKAVLLSTLLLCSFLLSSLPILAQSTANTIIVDKDGSGDFTTITAAVAAANNGDTIVVHDGVYEETDIIVEKSINLVGEDKNTTIIQGTGSRTILVLVADYIQVSQFTIANGGNMMDANIAIVANDCLIFNNHIDGSNDMGIALHNSSRCIIENNTISYCSNLGIRLYENNIDNIIRFNNMQENGLAVLSESSSDNRIMDNSIKSNDHGIVFFDSLSNTIENNQIMNSKNIGIIFYDNSRDNTIQYNQIESNDIGIRIEYSSDNLLLENTLLSNTDGIMYMNSSGNTCIGNEVSSDLSGIYLYNSHNMLITENHVSECSKGIYIEESTENSIKRNQLISNKQGLFVSYADENIISENNFISNDEHAKFTTWLSPTGLQISSWNENYWDNSLGLFPKIIPGILFIRTNDPIGIFFPWFSVDWNPASTPYP